MLQVFEFIIDEQGKISPLFNEDRLTNSVEGRVLEIIGSCTSLLTISEVADFFDYRAEVDYEWNFTYSEFVKEDIMLAVVSS
ncbi:hypothetical protein [Sporosarcina highlanderae]|uniref:Uncharacterized protein n=1 Tax=Sporosarcina highlanderae TaxID=3035916 RepID=A0ABT8JVM5_9BACL|nr:hypothetical protein [Sporosarcina highlanderae]MDN4609228.1 hypothetical protein [Sporosarcina highlanderae]